MLGLHPGKCLVRHIDGKVVTRIVRRLDADGSVKNRRRPLIGLATNEAVEFVEARMRWPTIKRSGNGDLPRRRFVILAKGSGAVAIESQHFRQWRDALRPNAGITW